MQSLLGHPMQGSRSELDAIDLARRLRHAPSLAHALWAVSMAQIVRNDVAAVVDSADELLKLSNEHGLAQTRAAALAYLGWALGQAKDVTKALAYLNRDWRLGKGLGYEPIWTFTFACWRRPISKAADTEAVEKADLAIATSSEIGDRWCLPRIHTIRGRILQQFLEVDAAEANLRMAVDIAAARSAKGAELHAANFLARLWRDQGKVQQARELLAPVYGWFTEGFDTRDLKGAKALLNELAA